MDIQIKRKPIDKNVEVIVAINKYVNGPAGSIKETIERIDEIYNSEDEGEIEEVRITDSYKVGITHDQHRFPFYIECIMAGGYKSTLYMSKKELAQYIEILNQIHDQMEG